MAMGEFRKVNGVTRQIKKEYRTVNSITREIKKQYRTVNGTTRQFFSSTVETIKYLFNNGDMTSLTGGWIMYKSYQGTNPSVTVKSDHILCDFPYSAYYGAMSVCTVNPIDITGYSKLHVEGTFTRNQTSNDLGIKIGLRNSTSNASWENMDSAVFWHSTGATSGSFSITTNLSLTGNQYPIIGICENYGSNTTQVKITKVWLEV